MEETIQELLLQKDEYIDVLKGRLERADQHIRMQSAYLTLLEAALKQYNILLDIKDGSIITRQFTETHK